MLQFNMLLKSNQKLHNLVTSYYSYSYIYN